MCGQEQLSLSTPIGVFFFFLVSGEDIQARDKQLQATCQPSEHSNTPITTRPFNKYYRPHMAVNDFSLTYPGNPLPGDLIEVFRPGYQHWALYLGDGYVINLTPLEDGIPASFTSAKSVFSRKALVKMQLLKDVAGNDTYRINNKYDETYSPLPMEEVMQRSEFVIGQEVEYDVLINNCEHFVTLLRYGEGVSEQANRAIRSIGFVTAAAGAFSFLGLFLKRQRAKYY